MGAPSSSPALGERVGASISARRASQARCPTQSCRWNEWDSLFPAPAVHKIHLDLPHIRKSRICGHQACVLSQLPVKSRSLAPLVMTNDSCQWRKPPAIAKRWPRLEWGTRLRWCRPSGYLPPTSSISSVCAWLQSSSARLWMLPRDS